MFGWGYRPPVTGDGAAPSGSEPGGRWEEGTYLTPYAIEITAFLQFVLERLEAGDEDSIKGDPWFTRGEDFPPLTDEDVDRVIAALDLEYGHEIGTYPSYHRNRSGATAPPEFHRLSPRARRAVVETLDTIVMHHPKPSAQE